MANILLDNLLKVFRGRTTITGNTLVSTELDFDIPRGFVIRIHEVILEIKSIIEDFEGISVDKLATIRAALIRDPDDVTSILIPDETVDHDVLVDLEGEVLIVAGVAGDTVGLFRNMRISINFSAEGVDVITARNLRMNVQAVGTDAADVTEASINATIHYTLEKITDADILALLDIL